MSELIRIATPKEIMKFAWHMYKFDQDYFKDYQKAIDNLTKQGYDFGELFHFLVYAYNSRSSMGRNEFTTVIREEDQLITVSYDYGKEIKHLSDLVDMYLTSRERTVEQRKARDVRKSPYTMLTFPDGVKRLERVVRKIAGNKYEIKIVKRPK